MAVQLFVAALGASSYIYAEVTWTQGLADWIGSHTRAFAFVGGVTAMVAPDNLKLGITKACFYEPAVNRSCALGSATHMPFADASFDRITAFESAHHYNTREDFFREAFRVLRPGGRLATADMLAVDARPKRWLQRLGNKIFHTPTANMYPRSGYARRLKDAGFTGVCVRVPSLALLENIEDGMCWHLSQQKIGRITNEP
jgi:transposase